MADVFSPEVRSRNMSRIRSTNTKPEVLVRKYLFSKGIRYRKNVRRMPGVPDIVLKKYRSIIFVNGCFWHGHEGCRCFIVPGTRTEWWLQKIMRNASRDKENIQKLQNQGWTVYTVWECEIEKNLQETMDSVISRMKEKADARRDDL